MADEMSESQAISLSLPPTSLGNNDAAPAASSPASKAASVIAIDDDADDDDVSIPGKDAPNTAILPVELLAQRIREQTRAAAKAALLTRPALTETISSLIRRQGSMSSELHMNGNAPTVLGNGYGDTTIRRRRWSNEEDAKLRDACDEYGSDWDAIAKVIPGRLAEQCMRRWQIIGPTIGTDYYQQIQCAQQAQASLAELQQLGKHRIAPKDGHVSLVTHHVPRKTVQTPKRAIERKPRRPSRRPNESSAAAMSVTKAPDGLFRQANDYLAMQLEKLREDETPLRAKKTALVAPPGALNGQSGLNVLMQPASGANTPSIVSESSNNRRLPSSPLRSIENLPERGQHSFATPLEKLRSPAKPKLIRSTYTDSSGLRRVRYINPPAKPPTSTVAAARAFSKDSMSNQFAEAGDACAIQDVLLPSAPLSTSAQAMTSTTDTTATQRRSQLSHREIASSPVRPPMKRFKSIDDHPQSPASLSDTPLSRHSMTPSTTRVRWPSESPSNRYRQRPSVELNVNEYDQLLSAPILEEDYIESLNSDAVTEMLSQLVELSGEEACSANVNAASMDIPTPRKAPTPQSHATPMSLCSPDANPIAASTRATPVPCMQLSGGQVHIESQPVENGRSIDNCILLDDRYVDREALYAAVADDLLNRQQLGDVQCSSWDMMGRIVAKLMEAREARNNRPLGMELSQPSANLPDLSVPPTPTAGMSAIDLGNIDLASPTLPDTPSQLATKPISFPHVASEIPMEAPNSPTIHDNGQWQMPPIDDTHAWLTSDATCDFLTSDPVSALDSLLSGPNISVGDSQMLMELLTATMHSTVVSSANAAVATTDTVIPALSCDTRLQGAPQISTPLATPTLQDASITVQAPQLAMHHVQRTSPDNPFYLGDIGDMGDGLSNLLLTFPTINAEVDELPSPSGLGGTPAPSVEFATAVPGYDRHAPIGETSGLPKIPIPPLARTSRSAVPARPSVDELESAEYIKFLQSLVVPGEETNELPQQPEPVDNVDDPEEDCDFTADLQPFNDHSEEFRRDRSSIISQREYQDLVMSSATDDEEMDGDDGEMPETTVHADGAAGMSPNGPRKPRPTGQSKQATYTKQSHSRADNLLFTADQLDMLRRQQESNLQLLLQAFTVDRQLSTDGNTATLQFWQRQILDLVALRDDAVAKSASDDDQQQDTASTLVSFPSFHDIVGLDAAKLWISAPLPTTASDEQFVRELGKPVRRRRRRRVQLEAESYQYCYLWEENEHKPLELPWHLRQLSHAFAPIFDDALLPRIVCTNTRARVFFLPAQDALLLIGLHTFGDDWHTIRSQLLPTMTAKQLVIRFGNLKSRRYPKNPVKDWHLMRVKPLSLEEEEKLRKGVAHFGRKFRLLNDRVLRNRPAIMLRQAWREMYPIHPFRRL